MKTSKYLSLSFKRSYRGILLQEMPHVVTFKHFIRSSDFSRHHMPFVSARRVSIENSSPHHLFLVNSSGKQKIFETKTVLFIANCKDSTIPQESYTFKTAKPFSSNRQCVSFLTERDQSLSGHTCYFLV